MDVNEQLRADLNGLDRWQSAVFAATCVEVLFPAYARFTEIEEVGDAELVRSSLDTVWALLESGRSERDDESELPSVDTVLDLLPEEEDWNDWAPQAENAIRALAYLLTIVDGGDAPAAAAQAAYQVEEAVDELANREPDEDEDDEDEDEGPDEDEAGDLVENETQRQADVVRALRDNEPGNYRIASTLRESSRNSALGGAE